MLPLVSDFTNPSPAIGWANTERQTIIDRGPTDLVFALALIHHLAISNNLPFDKIASFFASISNHLIIEFVPKQDSQVQKLLSTREDIFPQYDLKHFIDALSQYYKLIHQSKVPESSRTLLLLSK